MFNSFPIPKPDSGTSGVIKSYQSGTATWTDNTTTLDIPITTVNKDKSIIKVYINTNANSDISSIAPTFVDDKTIRLNRSSGATLGSRTIYWEVVEFINVKSKQSGTFASTSGGVEQTANLSASVNPLKCLLVVHQTSTTSSNAANYFLSGSRIASASSLVFLTAGTGVVIYYQLLEFS